MMCPLDLAKSIILDRKKLQERSPILLPSEWPSTQLKSLLPFYIEMLENNPHEKSLQIWLIINPNNKKVIGSLRLKSIATEYGTVDLGYEINYSYRNQGYGYEAAQALVNWLFLNEKVNKITAECDVVNHGSIRILQKLGMRCIAKEDSFLLWELNGGMKID